MRTSIGGLLPIVAVWLLSGCVATSGKLQPLVESTDEVLAGAERIHLVKDCLIFEHNSEQQPLYSLDRNQTVCTNYLDSIETRLANRGFDNVEVKAVTGGLQAGPNRYALNNESHEERVYFPVPFANHELNQREAHIYAGIANDLNTTIRNFTHRYQWVESLRRIQYRSLDALEVAEGDLVMMVLTAGLYYSPGATAAQAITTTVLSLGMLTGYAHGQTVARIVILDHEGRPIWADVAFNTLVYESGDGVNALLTRLFQYFPDVNHLAETN